MNRPRYAGKDLSLLFLESDHSTRDALRPSPAGRQLDGGGMLARADRSGDVREHAGCDPPAMALRRAKHSTLIPPQWERGQEVGRGIEEGR